MLIMFRIVVIDSHVPSVSGVALSATFPAPAFVSLGTLRVDGEVFDFLVGLKPWLSAMQCPSSEREKIRHLRRSKWDTSKNVTHHHVIIISSAYDHDILIVLSSYHNHMFIILSSYINISSSYHPHVLIILSSCIIILSIIIL